MPISLRLYLDTRKLQGKEKAPLRMVFCRGGKPAYLSLGISIPVKYWDKNIQQVLKSCPDARAINTFIRNRYHFIENEVRSLVSCGEAASMTITEIKNAIARKLSPNSEKIEGLTFWMESYIARCVAKRTKEIYDSTLRKIRQYDNRADSLRFDDINKLWLENFDAWLPTTGCISRNARNIHLRNIRAIFNDAIDNEKTTAYPFRRLSIKPETTMKRAVTVDELRSLFFYPVEDWQQKYVDAFRLIFCLIGINVVDLLSALPAEKGRVVYKRAKTGRLYSIKIEPEAAEIIEKYAGQEHLVSWGENRRDYTSFTMALDREIKRIGEIGGFTPFTKFTSYVARHSWATIAAELDIPNETIAAALGHGYGNKTTSIYINYNPQKVDDANRKVIDWVFYGKR